MAHRRSHAVTNFNEIVGANECPSLTSPSPPQPSSSTAPKRPLSAFKARKKRGLSLHVPADDFVFNLNDIGSTIHGEPVKLEDASFPCSSVTDDDALALMRNMSITPRSNSNSSNSSNSSRSKSFSFSFSPTPAKTVASKAPEPSVPLFLVPNWETPAILASEYRIVGILGK